jgi:hypothetical protein
MADVEIDASLVIREASHVKRPNPERNTLHEIRFTGFGRVTLHARPSTAVSRVRFNVSSYADTNNLKLET